ncbi:MAG: hypothetical protein KF768_04470 [Phycisphaeraceae bacterium]|nr:hypothetical protein [Phycisphaeraceae bacterium]
MTRIVLRLALTILLIPAAIISGVLLGMFVDLSYGRLGEEWVVAGAVTWCCVAYAVGYWLIWRGVVAWTARRKVRTAVTAAIGVCAILVLDAAVALSTVYMHQWVPWIMLINGGTTVTWLIVVSVIWAETPRERAARIASAGSTSTLCPACRYDLAGLSNLRCPECGNEFTLGRFQDEQRRRLTPADLG